MRQDQVKVTTPFHLALHSSTLLMFIIVVSRVDG